MLNLSSSSKGQWGSNVCRRYRPARARHRGDRAWPLAPKHTTEQRTTAGGLRINRIHQQTSAPRERRDGPSDGPYAASGGAPAATAPALRPDLQLHNPPTPPFTDRKSPPQITNHNSHATNHNSHTTHHKPQQAARFLILPHNHRPHVSRETGSSNPDGGVSGFGGIPESETDCDARAGTPPQKAHNRGSAQAVVAPRAGTTKLQPGTGCSQRFSGKGTPDTRHQKSGALHPDGGTILCPSQGLNY